METEHFLSGYCRMSDASRMVTLVEEQGRLLEVDCCYASCPNAKNCTIAIQIAQLTETES